MMAQHMLNLGNVPGGLGNDVTVPMLISCAIVECNAPQH